MIAITDKAITQTAGTPVDGLPLPRRYVAIAAVSLGTMLTTVDGAIVNVALPTLARDLHVESAAAVLVVTVYQLVLMMTVLPFSALGDRIGYRTTYQYGQIVFVVATLLCFFAHSLPFLLIVRAFQALGAAAVLSVASAMIRSIYPASRLGRGLAINIVIGTVTSSLAPTIGGAILTVARWPWLFAVCVPLGIFSILLGRKALPEPKTHNDPYDVLAAVMCAAMFGFAIVGLESGVHGDSPVISAMLIALSVAIGVVFVRRETGKVRPVLPIDLLKQRSIALSIVGLVAAFIGTMIVMLSLPFRLQQVFHYSPTEAGLVLAPWPLTIMVVAPISGILSDRFAAGRLGAIGMTFGTAGMIALAYLPVQPSHFDIIWRLTLCGLGYGMYFSPMMRQIVGSVPAHRTAAASALASTGRMTGQTLGATTVSAMLAAGVGLGSVPSFIAAALAVLAGLCCLVQMEPPARRPAPEDMPDLYEPSASAGEL
jgi:DHA2 family multidrug resistance protein-like MFS transporter